MNLSKSHKSYFSAAKAMSELSKVKQTKMGCAVIYKHKVISSGCNRYKTNPLQKKYNKYRFYEDEGRHCVHAETDALIPLLDRRDINFSNVSIYIYREHKNGDLGLARPCPSCQKLIRSLGIRFVYYTGENSYIGEEFIY